MERVTLPATIVQKEEGYLATIDKLKLVGKGTTVKEAQDDLVEKFTAWVQSCEGQGSLEKVLSEVGFDGVDQETELDLEFVE